jgi:hypothetical protein
MKIPPSQTNSNSIIILFLKVVNSPGQHGFERIQLLFKEANGMIKNGKNENKYCIE